MVNLNIDIAQFIELYNPLAFKDTSGSIMYFKTYADCYKELLERIYKSGPYLIDCVVFCMDNYGMKIQDAKRFVNSWQRYVGLGEDFVLIDWKNGGKARDVQLEQVARALHLLSETKFQKDMFLFALSEMKEKLKVTN